MSQKSAYDTCSALFEAASFSIRCEIVPGVRNCSSVSSVYKTHTTPDSISVGRERERRSQECLLQVKSGSFCSFVCRLLRRCGMQTSQKQGEKGKDDENRKRKCAFLNEGRGTHEQKKRKRM